MQTAHISTPTYVARRQMLRTALAALFMFVASSAAASEGGWPALPMPTDARSFGTSGEQLKVNGLPTRIDGFVSSRSPDDLGAWYRQQLGQPIADGRIGKRRILGKKSGTDYYITVQLDEVAGGTRGVVSVASLKDADRHHASVLATSEQWRNRLPAGSRLLSHIASGEAGHASIHLVFSNRHDQTLNRERIKRLMHEDGLELERVAAKNASEGDGRDEEEAGSTLYFKGRGREAIATVSPAGAGGTDRKSVV